MSSSHNIEQALAKARNTLLMRFMAILLLCLILVEVVVGVMFFFDLYRTEKKILNSMATEYQRILTYDSADQLIHVLTANPYRLIENNIAAFLFRKSVLPAPTLSLVIATCQPTSNSISTSLVINPGSRLSFLTHIYRYRL